MKQTCVNDMRSPTAKVDWNGNLVFDHFSPSTKTLVKFLIWWKEKASQTTKWWKLNVWIELWKGMMMMWRLHDAYDVIPSSQLEARTGDDVITFGQSDKYENNNNVHVILIGDELTRWKWNLSIHTTAWSSCIFYFYNITNSN